MNTKLIDVSPNVPKMTVASAAKFVGCSVQAIYKQLKKKNITLKMQNAKTGFIDYGVARQLFNFDFKLKKFAGQIVKGGTGKTTSIENIASCANTYGARVLKIDTDPQGNLTDCNSVNGDEYPVLIDVVKGDARIEDCIVPLCEGMDLIPSRIENVVLDNELVNKRLPLDKLYAKLLQPIEHNYDFIFIDCPPTMGQAVTAASLYADTVIAPLNPDAFSAKGLKILKQEIETLNKFHGKEIDYRIYLNKFSGKTILSDKALFSLISDPDLEGKMLTTTVQFTQEIPNITDENKNIFSILKKSSVRMDFDNLTRELLGITPDLVRLEPVEP